MKEPSRPGLPKVGDVEMAALEHLWRVGESDVLETHAAVGRPRGITPNTVGSALERLHKKGLLRREKVSHAYRYRPALTLEQFAARRLLDAAGDTKTLARTGMLSAFVDLLAEYDDTLLDRLAELVEQKRGGE